MEQTKSEKQYRRMMETPIPRLVTSHAIPTVIGMLVTVIYNTADTYFVSQINKSASAAVGVVYSIMAIIQAVGYGLGMGAGNLISLRLGEKNQAAADRYGSSAFFAAIGAGALVTALGLCFLSPMLNLLGCSATMMPYAIPYATYILISAPLNCSSFVLNSTLRAQGLSILAMWGIGIGGVINMVLDPIFIFGLGMGTGGAALATALSQAISFVILLYNSLGKRAIIRIRLSLVSRKLRDYGKIITTGLPTICRQGMGSVAAAVLNIQAVVYGDATVAAITIANKAYVLVRNIVVGLGQGFQPVAGYNYGAGNRKRAWKAFLFTGAVGTVICVVSAAAIALFAEPIMLWFCDDPDVAMIGRETLLLGCAVMPMMAFSTYVNQLYQCLGFQVPATLLACCRQGIFFVPAVLILPLFLGRLGVQASQPFADLATFVVSIPFLIYFYRKHLKNPDASPIKE